MPTEQFNLTLASGEIVICKAIGEGSRIAYIVGPGSFYFKGLKNAGLLNYYKFVTCDSTWTYKESSSLAGKKIDANKEDIKQRDHFIVEALKKKFNATEIDGFGFSAPGAFLIEEALERPQDFAQIIFTGLGLISLDPTFQKTNEIFNSKATFQKRKCFEEDQDHLKTLKSVIESKALKNNVQLSYFFALDPDSTLPLKPGKEFLAETIAMKAKLIQDDSDPAKAKKMIKKHWKHNVFGEHIDIRMQRFFFNNIYKEFSPLESLEKLANTGKKIHLIYGASDMVTPITEDILKFLEKYTNIKLTVLNDAAHIAYMECPEQYRIAVRMQF